MRINIIAFVKQRFQIGRDFNYLKLKSYKQSENFDLPVNRHCTATLKSVSFTFLAISYVKESNMLNIFGRLLQ